MSDYYNNQYPPQQQDYGDTGEQGYQRWQHPSGPPSGYGDQQYNQGYDQNKQYDYNSPTPPSDFQQPYSHQGGYQQPPHDQYSYSVNQYTSSPPEQNQHSRNQYTSPPEQPYSQPNYPSQAGDYGYNDQAQHVNSLNPPPVQTQYDDFSTPTGPPPSHMPPGYAAQPGAGAPVDPNDPNAATDRGLMGALAGGAVGGYAGHIVHHGFMGAIGGAIAGSLAEDALKKKKKDKKMEQRLAGLRRNSSSSSSSSDDEKKKRRNHGLAAVGVAGAGAYGLHQYNQQHHQQDGGQVAMRGNFSSSAHSITLDRDYDLIASCTDVHGEHKLSSISLNHCLTNSHGHFAWFRGGNFGASARHVKLIDGGQVLEAELGTGDGRWNRDRIRLDERISNNNGDLIFLE